MNDRERFDALSAGRQSIGGTASVSTYATPKDETEADALWKAHAAPCRLGCGWEMTWDGEAGMCRLERETDWDDLPSAQAEYGDPTAWTDGDRCPFCLASDGPFGFVDSPGLAGCSVCGVALVTAGEYLEGES